MDQSELNLQATDGTKVYDIEAKSVPTFYFIGVTTGKSSINKVFPLWMKELGRPDVVLEGMDLKIHDTPAAYRAAVAQIKYDPESIGALVTTHKIDLYDAAKDMFDYLDPYAVLRHAHVTGTSVGSAEVLEATLPLRELAGFVGQSAGPEARDALRASDAEVPIEISLDQGSLDHWDYTGADVAAVVPGTLSDEASSRLLIGEEFSYSLHLDPSVRLTAPPSARVTRDPNRPCGAGTSNV